jgi:alpha-N-arabinofuranosidase
MAAIPEFVLRKLVVKDSLKTWADGFSFDLLNTFAPAALTGFALTVDGKPLAGEKLSFQPEGGSPILATQISPATPFPFSVGVRYTLRVEGVPLGQGKVSVQADSREAGPFAFTFQFEKGASSSQTAAARLRLRRFALPLKAKGLIDANAVSGEISPNVYGHFIEHLERCLYGGIWTEDGARLREDALRLIKAIRPPIIRYPGGNFASGYHWEDGIGPKESRPRRFDAAWQSWESNQVGTDEFLAFCAEVGAAPLLVVNDGSGTPEEAARWVEYCKTRHPDFPVKIWGVGNEVWGRWQIGHTGPTEYAARLRAFVQAMRAVDPTIRIVAVGDKVESDSADDPGRLWNTIVLQQTADCIDDLSFHLYQPEREGWREKYDLESLHHTVCAAPLAAEQIILRIADQLSRLAPSRRIGIAFDEWNLWLPPPEGAGSMHQLRYTQRDALYAAAMFNVFHRQCRHLSMANLAQLVNVLPLIVTDRDRAYATPIYYPFWLYQHMARLALRTELDVPTFDSEALGNIPAFRDVPYLDLTATRDESGGYLALGLVNRHPCRRAKATLTLSGFAGLQPTQAWLLTASDPLAFNSFDAPEMVKVRENDRPSLRGSHLILELPAASVGVWVFKSMR